jgi:large subunit ribosomal protein L19
VHERLWKEGGKSMDLIKVIEQEQIRADLPCVEIGDYVRVSLKVKEGTRERIQVFEGTVVAKKGGGLTETFTVRRISYGVGVEKILPVNSPKIDGIEVVRKGKIRRAKLYYLRDRMGKAARVKEKLGTKVSKAAKNQIKEVLPVEEVQEVVEASVEAAVEENNE